VYVGVDPDTESDFHDASGLPGGAGVLFTVSKWQSQAITLP
jgi:hypothetical protein